MSYTQTWGLKRHCFGELSSELPAWARREYFFRSYFFGVLLLSLFFFPCLLFGFSSCLVASAAFWLLWLFGSSCIFSFLASVASLP